jgi:hypothetical protein
VTIASFPYPPAAQSVLSWGVAQASFPTDGLIHYYRLEETGAEVRLDSVGSSNLTSYGQQGQYIVAGAGISNNGADTVGTKTYRSLSSGGANLIPTGTGSYSLSFWVYARTGFTGGYLVDEGANVNGYRTYRGTLSGTVLTWKVATTSAYQTVTVGGVTPDTWHHIALAYDSTAETYYFWLDGVQVDSYNAVGGRNYFNPFSGALFTVVEAGGGCPLDVVVDEYAIFETALIQADIDNIYNEGTGTFY